MNESRPEIETPEATEATEAKKLITQEEALDYFAEESFAEAQQTVQIAIAIIKTRKMYEVESEQTKRGRPFGSKNRPKAMEGAGA